MRASMLRTLVLSGFRPAWPSAADGDLADGRLDRACDDAARRRRCPLRIEMTELAEGAWRVLAEGLSTPETRPPIEGKRRLEGGTTLDRGPQAASPSCVPALRPRAAPLGSSWSGFSSFGASRLDDRERREALGNETMTPHPVVMRSDRRPRGGGLKTPCRQGRVLNS